MGSQYCTPTDLLNAVNPLALTTITLSQQTQACIDASGEADSYMRARYNLPLATPYDPILVRHVAFIAVFHLLVARGFDPTSGGADDQIQGNYYKAVGDPRYPGSGYFPGIQRQIIHPSVVEAVASIGSVTQLPQVSTSAPRNWYGTSGQNGCKGIG